MVQSSNMTVLCAKLDPGLELVAYEPSYFMQKTFVGAVNAGDLAVTSRGFCLGGPGGWAGEGDSQKTEAPCAKLDIW